MSLSLVTSNWSETPLGLDCYLGCWCCVYCCCGCWQRRRRDDIRGDETTTHGTEGEKHRASQRSSEIRMCSPPHLPVGFLINAHPGAARHWQPRPPPVRLHAATTPVLTSVYTLARYTGGATEDFPLGSVWRPFMAGCLVAPVSSAERQRPARCWSEMTTDDDDDRRDYGR